MWKDKQTGKRYLDYLELNVISLRSLFFESRLSETLAKNDVGTWINIKSDIERIIRTLAPILKDLGHPVPPLNELGGL